MAQVFYNNVAGLLSGTHSAVTTTLTLQSGHNFPDPGTDYYLATLALLDSSARETAWEIVRVTDVTGDTLTVVRGQESTTALEWAGNSRIEARLTAGSLPGSQLGLRNRLINGGFEVWQRGAGPHSPGYTADRWLLEGDLALASRISRSAAGVGAYRLRVTRTIYDESDVILSQPLDSFTVNSLKGKTVTFSLYSLQGYSSHVVEMGIAKSATADAATATWTTVAAQTISFTSTSVRSSLTAAIPDDSTANGLRVFLKVSQNILSGDPIFLELQGLQLEEGPVATPFEYRPYGLEWVLCRRYYRKANFYVPATTAQNLGVIDMRAVPTITGGDTGFTSTGTTADTLIAYQTTGSVRTLYLDAELA